MTDTPRSRLASQPRISLAHLPTPLEPMPRLSKLLGGPDIWVKRDDCTGLATGGNKARKLEYLMAQAIAGGADTVITVGGLQSNHARQTAAAAAKLGLRCQLVLPKVVPIDNSQYEDNGNLLLDHLLGAEVYIEEDEAAAGVRLRELFETAKRENRKFAFFPAGGSTPTGSLAYVNAALEVYQQMVDMGEQFDAIYLASSTGGTLAGLLTGTEITKDWRPDIFGCCVATDDVESLRDEVKALCTGVGAQLSLPQFELSRCRLSAAFLGEGYGLVTTESMEAIKLCASTEGLLLDPVYSAKAMAALIDDIRSSSIRTKSVLFWHTGGSTGLFAYQNKIGKK